MPIRVGPVGARAAARRRAPRTPGGDAPARAGLTQAAQAAAGPRGNVVSLVVSPHRQSINVVYRSAGAASIQGYDNRGPPRRATTVDRPDAKAVLNPTVRPSVRPRFKKINPEYVQRCVKTERRTEPGTRGRRFTARAARLAPRRAAARVRRVRVVGSSTSSHAGPVPAVPAAARSRAGGRAFGAGRPRLRVRGPV